MGPPDELSIKIHGPEYRIDSKVIAHQDYKSPTWILRSFYMIGDECVHVEDLGKFSSLADVRSDLMRRLMADVKFRGGGFPDSDSQMLLSTLCAKALLDYLDFVKEWERKRSERLRRKEDE